MASTWVCSVLVFRQGCEFSKAGPEWEWDSGVLWGMWGAHWLWLCLLQSPTEEMLTGTSVKPFAYELHKFPDVSTWSGPRNCWSRARSLGCLVLFWRTNCPLLWRSHRPGRLHTAWKSYDGTTCPCENMVYLKFTVIQTLSSIQKISEGLKVSQLLHFVSHTALTVSPLPVTIVSNKLGQMPSKQQCSV